MKKRLLALTLVVSSVIAASAPAWAGIGTSPGSRRSSVDQEMDHG